MSFIKSETAVGKSKEGVVICQVNLNNVFEAQFFSQLYFSRLCFFAFFFLFHDCTSSQTGGKLSLAANCPRRQTVPGSKLSGGKLSGGKLYWRQTFLAANCPVANCPGGKLSWRQTVRGGKLSQTANLRSSEVQILRQIKKGNHFLSLSLISFS